MISNTYDIHCDTCEVTYWFGQHSKEKGHSMVYSVDHLAKFLTDHKNHSLIVLDEHSSDLEYDKRANYRKEDDD